jgi:large subunit ribosomal protein L2
LHKGRPHDALIERKTSKTAGRNAHGHITTRHHGWRPQAALPRDRFPSRQGRHPGKVENLQYDPNRSPPTSRWLCTQMVSVVTSLPPKGMVHRAEVISGPEAPIKPGNTLPIRSIPVGTTIHCVEMMPGKGAQIARSAGTSAQLWLAKVPMRSCVLRSGEIRRIHVECRATIGEVGNEEHSLRKIGKAGAHALARHSPDGARYGNEPD